MSGQVTGHHSDVSRYSTPLRPLGRVRCRTVRVHRHSPRTSYSDAKTPVPSVESGRTERGETCLTRRPLPPDTSQEEWQEVYPSGVHIWDDNCGDRKGVRVAPGVEKYSTTTTRGTGKIYNHFYKSVSPQRELPTTLDV